MVFLLYAETLSRLTRYFFLLFYSLLSFTAHAFRQQGQNMNHTRIVLVDSDRRSHAPSCNYACLSFMGTTFFLPGNT
jgi:hypothetical protein